MYYINICWCTTTTIASTLFIFLCNWWLNLYVIASFVYQIGCNFEWKHTLQCTMCSTIIISVKQNNQKKHTNAQLFYCPPQKRIYIHILNHFLMLVCLNVCRVLLTVRCYISMCFVNIIEIPMVMSMETQKWLTKSIIKSDETSCPPARICTTTMIFNDVSQHVIDTLRRPLKVCKQKQLIGRPA